MILKFLQNYLWPISLKFNILESFIQFFTFLLVDIKFCNKKIENDLKIVIPCPFSLFLLTRKVKKYDSNNSILFQQVKKKRNLKLFLLLKYIFSSILRVFCFLNESEVIFLNLHFLKNITLIKACIVLNEIKIFKYIFSSILEQ